MIGVDPTPFTLRELCWMTDGVRRENWLHTSYLMWSSITYSYHVDPRKAPSVSRYNPYAEQAEEKPLPFLAMKDFIKQVDRD